MAPVAVLDDRLLIEELLVGLPHGREELHTTTYWYYRACRASVLGAGGHLSGPFARVDAGQQAAAIISLDGISLPDPTYEVPLGITGPSPVGSSVIATWPAAGGRSTATASRKARALPTAPARKAS